MNEFNNMSNAVMRTVDHAEASAHRAFAKTSDVARPVLEQLGAGVTAAAERLGKAASSAADRLEVTGETLKDAPAKMTKICRMYVREKPMTSVGVALAMGYLLSWALRQR